MKRKGTLSLLLTICLMLSNISIQAFGAEEDSKGLEKAIVAAKNIVTVPDTYTEFTHSSSERETSTGNKIRLWRLNWAEKEGKNGYVAASVGEDGFLYEYNKYTGIDNNSGLAKVTKDQAQILAEEFLKNVTPKYAEQIKKVDNSNNIFSGEEYNFSYQEFKNEVPASFININIGVNKYSGEITYFNGENPEINGIEYPSLEGVIDTATAEKSYLEKLGVNLKYYSYYDYKEKKMKIFAGYSIDNNINSAIDAKTGQAISLVRESLFPNGKGDYAGMAASDNIMKTNQELTKEETEAVNNVANLISKEKAESILRGTSDIITSDMKVKDVSLNKNEMNQGYIWYISFDNAYGEVDAKSGEVISIHSYNLESSSNKNMTKDEAKNIAESFLKKVTPDKFAKTKYEDIENPILKINVIQEGNIYSLNYVRLVNGIEFSSNSLRVEVDKTKGKIIGYDSNWYDNASFPDISQAMSKEQAFNKIKNIAGFSLQYTMLDKNKIGLVYNFTRLNEGYIIEPINGTRLDFSGQVYKENKAPSYTDISGQWCEKTVKELLDNGYYLEGDKFNPDMNINQINFFKYIYSSTVSNLSDDEFYDMLIQSGIVKKEEKAPNSLVSNQDAAKYIIRFLGYDKVAVHPEVFINPFKDSVQEQYKGYAAMCYGLNIMKGDNNGNFNGTRNITNAQAATIIYNLIKSNSK